MPLSSNFIMNWPHDPNWVDPTAGMTEVEKLQYQIDQMNRIGCEVLDDLAETRQELDNVRRLADELVALVRLYRDQVSAEDLGAHGDKELETLDKLYALVDNSQNVVACPSYQTLTRAVTTLFGALSATGLGSVPEASLDSPALRSPGATLNANNIPVSAYRMVKYALADAKKDCSFLNDQPSQP